MIAYEFQDETIYYHHTVNLAGEPLKTELHMHDCCEFYYFISGKAYFAVEGNQYPLRPGHILLIREGETHCIHTDSNYTYERMVVHFPFDFLPRNSRLDMAPLRALFYGRELGEQNLFIPPPESHGFLACCMNRLFEESNRPRAAEKPDLKLLTYLLPVLNELCMLQAADHESFLETGEEKRRENELVAAIVAYITKNLHSIRDLSDLEKQFFMSATYLNKLFKRATGTTLWNYIQLKRLLYARARLREGVPATVVARECGAAEYSSFYRMYKKTFGVSPQTDKAILT